MPSRFAEVVPDFLYRGGAPSPKEIPILKKVWGIEKIISLDAWSGSFIDAACRDNGVKHIMLPIHGVNHDKSMDRINSEGATNIIGKDRTYVHCKWGKDRTGMFIARYRVENGATPKEALREAVDFGFGLGVQPESVEQYLNVINDSASDPVTMEDYNNMVEDTERCGDCGMVMQNGKCPNCSKNNFALNVMKGNIPSDAVNQSKETSIPMGDTIERSDMFAMPSHSPTYSLEEKMSSIKNNKVRRAIVEGLSKTLLAQQVQHMSKPISLGEKARAEELIKYLKEFLDLIDILILKPTNKMLDLFQNNDGVNYEVMKKTNTIDHFKAFGKNIKNNMWRLIGGRYIDIIDDLKPNGVTYDEAKDKKTIFDVIIDRIGIFSNDSHISPLQESLKEALRGLADLVTNLGNFMESNLDDKDFQTNATNVLVEIQNQCGKIKSIVKDGIIRKIMKDVIGENKDDYDKKEDVRLKYEV